MLPLRIQQDAPTPVAMILADCDAMLLRYLPDRRFFVRAIFPGEFDPLPVTGDEHGRPQFANAIILDRTRPGMKFTYYAACVADLPQSDRDVLAFMRRGGLAI
jgi:hypothetical protein